VVIAQETNGRQEKVLAAGCFLWIRPTAIA